MKKETVPVPVDRLRTLLIDGAPRVYCCPCLAAKLSLPESSIRDAAQFLSLQAGFTIVDESCSICGTGDRLVAYRPTQAG